MERKIDEWLKSQNHISSERTDRTDPPPPPGQVEQLNVVFTAWDARDALGYILDCTLKDLASDEELEELMKDQPLSADASPTALSPGYIADSNPEEDKEDPEEDPADHPADG
ncbi:hypothetical protein Tco_0454311 [Tanacetum coccineum]